MFVDSEGVKMSKVLTRGRWWAIGALAAAALVVSTGTASADENPPVVTVGANTPDGSNSATAQSDSSGTTNGCVNDSHSSVSPSGSGSGGSASVNDGSCSTSGSSGGSGSSGSSAGAAGSQSRGASGSASAGARAGTAGRRAGAAQGWVMASSASGLRIARVRYRRAQTASTHRLPVVVTLRDRSGRLVRDAIVSVAGVAQARPLVGGPHTTYTNQFGNASFVLPVGKAMLGKRLVLDVSAHTPSARTSKLSSVLLPH